MRERTQFVLRATQSPSAAPRTRLALRLALLTIPLVLALVWGAYFDDGAYVAFRSARNLALGRGLAYPWALAAQTPPDSPLYALVLVLPARLGLPLPPVSLILSALGWGLAAVALFDAIRATRRPMAAPVSAALLAFSPVVVATLGTAIPWVVALAWVAVLTSARKRWGLRTGSLVLLVCARFDASTLAFTALLLAFQWHSQRRFPLRHSLTLMVTASALVLLSVYHITAPFPLPHLSLSVWRESARELLAESDLYWLLPPLVAVGLIALPRRAAGAALAWAAVSIADGGQAAQAMTLSLAILAAGLGVEWIIRRLSTGDPIHLTSSGLAASLAIVLALPLAIAQGSSLARRYQSRPAVRQELEAQAGDWLRSHSEPSATLLAAERVGYLADRTTLAWAPGSGDPAALARQLGVLDANPPEYCVTHRGLYWDRLLRTSWFQSRYTPLQTFASHYEGLSPYTIWGDRLRLLDLGEHEPLYVRLPGGAYWLGYNTSPRRIQPGDTVHVTLFLQATPDAPQAFRAIARLTSPHDDVEWAREDTVDSRSVVRDWGQTVQVTAEQFTLITPDDMPVGGYRLESVALAPDSESVLPIYRDSDTAQLDRIVLGYVAVPWEGEPDIAEPVEATFGGQIRLLGLTTTTAPTPGSEFEVRLYWEALRPPDENYVVFVHLLDENGRSVANHDGVPMEGRYPTRAWLPGDTVPDVHRIALAPDLPTGTYQLRVGLYSVPEMERLPVLDGQGIEQPDRTLTLGSVELR
jgi:hypothetical protein